MVKKMICFLVLLLGYTPIHAQANLKLRVSLDSAEKFINLTFFNADISTMYLPSTFQNYHFWGRFGGFSDNPDGSATASGIILKLENIRGNKVRLNGWHGHNYIRKVKMERASAHSKLNYFWSTTMYSPRVKNKGAKLVNIINKIGICIAPGDSAVAKIKINKHFFYRKNYYFGDSLKSSSYVLMRVGYRNIVPRNYLQDSTIRYCDSLFTGLIYSENVLKINLK